MCFKITDYKSQHGHPDTTIAERSNQVLDKLFDDIVVTGTCVNSISLEETMKDPTEQPSEAVDTTQFIKLDTGKRRLSLLEPHFILSVGDVITFGATKYSIYGITPSDLTIGRISQTWKQNSIQEIQSVQLVTQNQYESKKLWNVDAVTTDDLRLKYQDTEKNKCNSLQNGTLQTETKCVSMSELETKILNENESIKKLDGINYSKSAGLHNHIMIVVLNKDAQYVNQNSNSLISTIAMKQDCFVEYFVVSATTDSECLETIYRVLEKLSLISNPLNQKLIRSGANNWRLCEDTSRYKDALLRHIYAYLSGERYDQETGIEHIAHASCNLMFLQYFDNLNKDQQ